MDQELMSHALGGLADSRRTHAAASGGRTLNDVTAAVLKLWHTVNNPTLSVDAYLLEEQDTCSNEHGVCPMPL